MTTTVLVTPDECLPDHVTVEVSVDGIRGTMTCRPKDVERVQRTLVNAILNLREPEVE